MSARALVIAVDGPSGSGKSSTARRVAQELGLAYLDTGAMYRGVTWALLQRGVDLSDLDAVAREAETVQLSAGTDPEAPSIQADGIDVTDLIREPEVTDAVSVVAAVPGVRNHLVRRQQALIAEAADGIVAEGRDIGTTVAPQAPLKVFLVADAAARAARRTAERGGDLGGTEQAVTLRSLARRDQIDSTRAASPLRQAPDALVIDGTHRTLEEVVDQVVGLARAVQP